MTIKISQKLGIDWVRLPVKLGKIVIGVADFEKIQIEGCADMQNYESNV